MNPKDQKITPAAPPGHYFWMRLDDAGQDPLILGWWLELRRHRRFWFDKVVLRAYIADYNQSEYITPTYLDAVAYNLVNAYRKVQLRKELERKWKDYTP